MSDAVQLALITAVFASIPPTIVAIGGFIVTIRKVNTVHVLTNTNFTEQKQRIAQLEAAIKAEGNISPAPPPSILLSPKGA